MAELGCMNFGVVPIVTDVGSIGEDVKDSKNGKNVEVKDTDSIVKAIVSIDGDRGLLSRMSEKARNAIFTRLKPEDYVKKLNGIYYIMSKYMLELCCL